jgi:hypothetical protein
MDGDSFGTFPLGQVVATPGVLQALKESGQSALDFLSRHRTGDWGDVSDVDKELNNQAVKDGDRILSAYHTSQGVKVWVLTESDRSATTLLLPAEY